MEKTIRCIRWRDSKLYLEQITPDDLDVCFIVSVGFVIEETDSHIVLAGDLIDGDIRRAIVIPKENILSDEN